MLFARIEKAGSGLIARVRTIYEKNQEKKTDELKKYEFMQELELARSELAAARNNYNFAKDPSLLEYYIYEIKAAETRLNYYLQRAKKENIVNDAFSGLQFCASGKRNEEFL